MRTRARKVNGPVQLLAYCNFVDFATLAHIRAHARHLLHSSTAAEKNTYSADKRVRVLKLPFSGPQHLEHEGRGLGTFFLFADITIPFLVLVTHLACNPLYSA